MMPPSWPWSRVVVEPVQADPERAASDPAAASPGVPMVATQRMSSETFAPPSGTTYEASAAGWQGGEAAVIAELAEATVDYGSPLAAAQALFGSHSGKPLRSG